MRLIDADALNKAIREACNKAPSIQFGAYMDALFLVEDAPTVEPKTLDEEKHIEMLGREYVAQDIENGKGFIVGHFIREPITRCKDCEYYNGLIECETGLLTDPDDFCKFGKKKEANE